MVHKRKIDQALSANPLTRAEFQSAAPNRELPPGFWDFRGLMAQVPLGERTLRTLIKNKILPAIRPGIKGRRLLFHPDSVTKALLRFQIGGIED